MGLERLSSILQGKHNNYDIDLFQTIIKYIAQLLDVEDLSSVNLLHYMVVFEKLFKMHFDVFGLIDKGLAIDINTLTK
jgi:alanyl-tRNA synthetase